jgi:restriction system protein
MSIWTYNASAHDPVFVNSVHGAAKCVFCGALMLPWGEPAPTEAAILEMEKADSKLCEDWEWGGFCGDCGWWFASVRLYGEFGYFWGDSHRVGAARLKEFSITNLELPLDEVQAYLLARWEKRFSISPRVFQDTVQSVFANLGYVTRATGFHNDGGIDVVLECGDGSSIGVQVKRYRNRIKVGVVRELLGALMLQGHARGIVVTTSDFQKGCYDTARVAAHVCRRRIELMNGNSFLEALRLARRGSAHPPQYANLWDLPIVKHDDTVVRPRY